MMKGNLTWIFPELEWGREITLHILSKLKIHFSCCCYSVSSMHKVKGKLAAKVYKLERFLKKLKKKNIWKEHYQCLWKYCGMCYKHRHGIYLLVMFTFDNSISRSHATKRHMYHLKYPRVNLKKTKGEKFYSWMFRQYICRDRHYKRCWSLDFLLFISIYFFQTSINRTLGFVEVTIYHTCLSFFLIYYDLFSSARIQS